MSNRAQGHDKLSSEEFAEEFVRLTTLSSDRRWDTPAEAAAKPLAKWEHPMTWTVIGAPAASRVTKLGVPIRMGLASKLALANAQTKWAFKETYRKPQVLSPPGFAPAEDDWAINSLTNVDMSFELSSASDIPVLKATFVSPNFTASISSNLLVVYGQRRFLVRFRDRLPAHGMETFSMDRGGGECSAHVWSTARYGIGSAVVMVDDLLPWTLMEVCLSEAVGRVLGVRGEASENVVSVFSRDRQRPMGTSSGFDAAIIKMLYDPEVKSGMSRQELSQVARRLSDKYWPR